MGKPPEHNLDLSSLSPTEFERRIKSVLEKRGLSVRHVGGTADGGIDLEASSDDVIAGGRLIVQCKRYSPGTSVTVHDVRELYGVLIHNQANKAIIITTSGFTAAAQEFAKGKPLELIDGDKLRQILEATGELGTTPQEPKDVEDPVGYYEDYRMPIDPSILHLGEDPRCIVQVRLRLLRDYAENCDEDKPHLKYHCVGLMRNSGADPLQVPDCECSIVAERGRQKVLITTETVAPRPSTIEPGEAAGFLFSCEPSQDFEEARIQIAGEEPLRTTSPRAREFQLLPHAGRWVEYQESHGRTTVSGLYRYQIEARIRNLAGNERTAAVTAILIDADGFPMYTATRRIGPVEAKEAAFCEIQVPAEFYYCAPPYRPEVYVDTLPSQATTEFPFIDLTNA